MFEFTDKDPAIVAVVERLWERLGPEAFLVADLYQASRSSIDLYHPDSPFVVVHLTCRGEEPERYGYQLEVPPHESMNELYQVVGRGSGVTFEELVLVVAKHLQTADTQ